MRFRGQGRPRGLTSPMVVVHNEIKAFLSNIPFAHPAINCYKSTFLLAFFDNN